MKVKFKSFGFSFLVLLLLYAYSPLFQTLITSISVLVLLATLAWQMGPFVSRIFIKPFAKILDTRDKAVLITGCDSGFGHGSALLLNSMGFKVYAGCLSLDGLGPATLKSKASQPDRMILVKMNVTSEEEIDQAYNQIVSTMGANEKLWGLVNNAGIFRQGPIEMGDFDFFVREQFDVNVFAVVKVTRKFSPLIRKARGRIVVLSSLASRSSIAPLAAYCMTKHAIAAFCDCLRSEIGSAGVQVISIEPYFYNTNLINSKQLTSFDDKCWNTTPLEMRTAFGESEYKKTMNRFSLLLKSNGIGPGQDPAEVCEAVAKALVDPEPPYRYVCSSPYLKPIFLIGAIVPREFFVITQKRLMQRFSPTFDQAKKFE
ncbi:D-beta-hydroxybutyrate dehydrogenase, mitochondrial-like [Brevipalpus obovatus]|uniref:D-beta-hydroxybutyrate dehydrogenase, mitochondrial-like n=1 Tax=Brevipalpus obovatus TaxID=246614 RepID=UPI003D9E406F